MKLFRVTAMVDADMEAENAELARKQTRENLELTGPVGSSRAINEIAITDVMQLDTDDLAIDATPDRVRVADGQQNYIDPVAGAPWDEYQARIEKYGTNESDWYRDCLKSSPWDTYCIDFTGHDRTEGAEHRHTDINGLRWPAPVAEGA